ncbi:MAG TPA: FGGY family carbohydrate kinase, partial [Gemmata sp.]|nr:FGGY family carbohydrate kinase [Gemmata sp.]
MSGGLNHMSEYLMASPIVLSIDQGTTSSRSVVFDANTFAVLGSAQQEIEQHYPHDGWVEHEPEDIWYSVARTVREALAKANREPKNVAAIGITNQRETVVVWDRATGRAVHRAIVWQDRRTTDFCREHAADQPMLSAKTGLVLDPYFSGTKLRWLMENDANAKRAAGAGKLAAGTIDTFLIWRLTGAAAHVTDGSNASRTLLFNVHTMQWDDDLLRYFGIPRQLLPVRKPSAAEFGVTRGLDFLPDGIPVRGVAGDQQAALYGQGCFVQGTGKCTYGTGAFFLLHTGDVAVTSKHKLLTTVAAMTDANPKYALEGAVFIAGAAVQWLRDGLHLFKSSAEVERLARESNP